MPRWWKSRSWKGKKTFKNPRNAAAGSLRQKDSAVTRSRNLAIFVFNLQLVGGKDIRTHSASLEQMKNWGFSIIPFYKTAASIDEVIEEVAEDRSGTGFLFL